MIPSVFSRQSFKHCIILFRSVPLSIVTHTGIYKQRNGTEQEFLHIEVLAIYRKIISWLCCHVFQ